MKALITDVIFKTETEGKFGKQFKFEIHYNGGKALYTSKHKDQKNFVKDQECEFTEEEKIFVNKEGKEIKYKVVKPPMKQRGSNFGKALTKEQSRYSGFSESYVKDLLACGLLKPELTDQDEEFNDVVIMTWKKRSYEIFEHMVELDAHLEN